jgi:hypothetical protein
MNRLAGNIRRSFITALLCVSSFAVVAQQGADSSKHKADTARQRCSYCFEKFVSVLTGFNYWHHGFAEVGVAVNKYGITGHHPAAWAYFVSNEVRVDKRLIIGPKIGCWGGGGAAGMAMGLNMIWYTDFDNSSLRFRPEIGMGFDRFKVVYGYNIALTNSSFQGINTHNASVVVLWGVKKLKTIRMMK